MMITGQLLLIKAISPLKMMRRLPIASRVFIEVSSFYPIPLAIRPEVKKATLPDFTLQALLKQYIRVHHLPAPFNIQMPSCFCHFLLELPTSLGFLLWSPVFYHCSSPLEVESIFALQYGGFSNRSCHINTPFF